METKENAIKQLKLNYLKLVESLEDAFDKITYVTEYSLYTNIDERLYRCLLDKEKELQKLLMFIRGAEKDFNKINDYQD